MRSISGLLRFVSGGALGVTVLLAGTAGAQQPPAQPQPGQAQPGQPAPAGDERPDWQKRIEDFRKRADDRMKTLLQASDEEYAVLKPRIEKLQGLQMSNDSRVMGFGMLMGGGGGAQSWRTRASEVPEGQRQERKPDEPGAARPAGGPPGGAAGGLMAMFGVQSNPAMDKAREIQQALESKEATAETLKTKLAELRALKKQAKEEITRTQEELRQLCTVRQETVLVLMGVLE
ncbi:hypothetical protein [Humisphaera borealis]|uniref:Periplasmic heavy metal sensor n=1 Tax=Humisphaera borealis TaxID=2807512 RepID=A0A7M2X2Y5_9BACT|nr:hypothetical protein [Humisphaera borealis]QOV92137.1 hypothetical protein IPV69_12590 [Humisphaera borealis]